MITPRLNAQNWQFQSWKRLILIPGRVGWMFVMVLTSLTSAAQKQTDQIKLNQVGYYPNSSKLAFITWSGRVEPFFVVTSDGLDTVYQGVLGEKRKSAYSSTITRIADFSLFTSAGSYVIRIGGKESYPFEIRNDVYTDLGKAVLKSFYYQRSSVAIDEKFAQQWNRSAKHSGDVVIVRPTSFADARGAVVSSPGGWYNKGDYNKYIVSSGVTMSQLLSSFEDFTNYFDTLKIDIPESGNKVPDVLNEAIFNLRWMLTMQDPTDGGVYYKCAGVNGDNVASLAIASRSEAIKKTTGASLDFAAVMAQAGRIFRKMRAQLPGLADSCLRASANAWFWALKHPNVMYDKSSADHDFLSVASFDNYGAQLNDEWLWAATEMYVSSRNDMYFDVIEQNLGDSVSLPSLNNVGMLAYFTMLRYEDDLPAYTNKVIKIMRERVLRLADDYVTNISASAFSTVMGQSKSDFTWGSNAIAANQGILLINAYLISGNEKYVSASMTNLDYILGRNATGYCFVTGCFGIKSPKRPYYRLMQSASEPIPGLLVAGPYCTKDKTIFSSPDIETAYDDSDNGAHSNRVSIDWNSSMVYLVNAVEAMQYELGFSPHSTTNMAINR